MYDRFSIAVVSVVALISIAAIVYVVGIMPRNPGPGVRFAEGSYLEVIEPYTSSGTEHVDEVETDEHTTQEGSEETGQGGH